MTPEAYQRYLDRIRYCKTLDALQEIVSAVIKPTGFGDNRVEGVDVGLNYYEMAICLKETDQIFFQKSIELLIFAHQQIDIIERGQVPEPPETVPTWQMFT